MNYLDLFAGIGGFVLGAYWAGWRFDEHYFSEVDDYCVELYKKRFPEAHPLGDIRNMEPETLPKTEWIVTGGFPCQDISIAGKGEGISGERSSLWFDMWRVIGILRPRFAIIENVGAITHRGLDTVLGCLTEIGYDAEWQDIQAADMGAPHKRERIWIVAYPKYYSNRTNGKQTTEENGISQKHWETGCGGMFGGTSENSKDVAYPQRDSGGGRYAQRSTNEERQTTEKKSASLQPENGETYTGNTESSSQDVADAEGTSIKRWDRDGRTKQSQSGRSDWWAVEPNVGRVAHGVPHRVDRLKALGNSIVPQIAELLFRRLKEIEDKTTDT